MSKKKTGSYYTPQKLANFIVKYIDKNFAKNKKINILEPSCGDGVFLKELLTIKKKFQIDSVELQFKSLFKAKIRNQNTKKINYINSDFLNFYVQKQNRKKYDLIIGNPPYIKKNHLIKEQIDLSKQINIKANLSDRIKNIWVSFLIASSLMLKKDGIIAFVLPAELLQVKFTQEIRDFLLKYFQRIEIFTFTNLIFKNIDQDTILFFAYKKSMKRGIYFTNIDNIKFMKNNQFNLKLNLNIQTNSIKWTHHILTKAEIELLYKLKEELKTINDYCISNTGIVTAANNYFIVNNETVEKYQLHSVTKNIIQRGFFVNGSVAFKLDDFEKLENSGKPCKLLHFEDDENVYHEKIKEYFRLGKKEKIDERYKCKIRNNWYSVPLIYSSEGFFFKRSHLYPKLVKNEANVFVTDSAYRIKMKENFDINSLVFSFYNSLTLTFAELYGRYYGGGVLELTPNEFKSLPLPYIKIFNEKFEKFSEKFENKSSIEEILKLNNTLILKKLNLTNGEIDKIEKIRIKLISKRCKN